MKTVVQIEYSASSSRSKHEGESSFGLCDRLSRTRDNSQRQLPTDQDYAASTREYQTDQSSLKTAPTAARSVLEKRRNQRQQQTHRLRRLTRSLHIRPMHSSTGSDHSSCSSEAKLFGIECSDLHVSKEDSVKPRCDQLDCLPTAPFCCISPEPSQAAGDFPSPAPSLFCANHPLRG
jgi:hypothetical protein